LRIRLRTRLYAGAAVGFIALILLAVGILTLTLNRMRGELVSFRLQRVRLRPSPVEDGFVPIHISPGSDSVVFLLGSKETVDLLERPSIYLLKAYDYEGNLLGSREFSDEDVPTPFFWSSGLAFLEDIGFVYLGHRPTKDEKLRIDYLVILGTDGDYVQLTELLSEGPSNVDGIFIKEQDSFIVHWTTRSPPREIAVYSFVNGAFVEQRRFRYSEDKARCYREVFRRDYVGWGDKDNDSFLLIDPKSMALVDDEEVDAELSKAIGPDMTRLRATILGVREEIVVGVADTMIAQASCYKGIREEVPYPNTLLVYTKDRHRGFIGLPDKHPGRIYAELRLLGCPTPTHLGETSFTSSATGPIVLFDGIANDLLLIESR